VFGCPEERLTEPPVKQCHNRDLSGGLLFYWKNGDKFIVDEYYFQEI
jgi:hypothetical protein